MASTILAEIDAQVTAATTVMSGATILIRGIAARIQAAVAEAQANGATAAELAPVKAVADAMTAQATDLSAAIVENTPAAPSA